MSAQDPFSVEPELQLAYEVVSSKQKDVDDSVNAFNEHFKGRDVILKNVDWPHRKYNGRRARIHNVSNGWGTLYVDVDIYRLVGTGWPGREQFLDESITVLIPQISFVESTND